MHRFLPARRPQPEGPPSRTAAPEAPVDLDRLRALLRAVAEDRRLELLRRLHRPAAAREIARDLGFPSEAIQEDLDALAAIGAVVPREGRGTAQAWAPGAPRLYELLEELRRAVGSPATWAEAPGGPHLVLVRGFPEGRAFPLRAGDLDGGPGWVVGRKPGLHVSLAYDPFVSLVNSEILLRGDRHLLADLGSSKNGTRLNGREVGEDPAPLAPGDVVGVGRSLLVFRR